MGERWECGNYKLSRCPVKVMTQEGLEYLEAYRFYKQGAFSGGNDWMMWSQTLRESIVIIDNEVAKIEREIQKKN